MNKQSIVATVVFSTIFVAMIIFYLHFIFAQSETVVNNPYNKRIDTQGANVVRGTIYSREGKALAYTDTNGTERKLKDDTRVYPYGKAFAHVIGITSHGKYGLEKQYNYQLLSSQTSAFQKILNDFSNTMEYGCNVYTTYNAKLQKVAYDSLGDNNGAVFAMDPETGEILVSTSKPSYDPGKIDEIWDDMNNDSNDSRLVSRATQGKYIPGSIFKIVTTLAYMRQDSNYDNFKYTCYGSDYSIKCFNGNAHYSEDLTHAFAYSCNSAFATIGNSLNVKRFRKTAKDLLFNEDLPLDMIYNSSRFRLNKKSTQFDITQTSIGQGETQVSPAHMCMIVSSIANDGVLMKPYQVSHIENSNGTIIEENDSKEFKKLMTKKEAVQLTKYMEAVCDYGTAKAMKGTLYKAYGKTGTAELDKDDNINSWFVGFATYKGKKIAIAVVLEDIKQGSDTAVNSAKEIFDSYFK